MFHPIFTQSYSPPNDLDQAGEGLRLSVYRGQVRQQLQDQTLFINDYRRASSFGGVGQVPFIPGIRHTIGYGDGPFLVQNNREWKAFPLHPSADRFLILVIDSKYQDIPFYEVRIAVTVPVTVAGSIASSR